MKNPVLSFLPLFVSLISCQTSETEAVPEDTTPSNVEVVRGMYDAFGEGDVEGVVSTMSPEVEWNEAENFIYADGNPYKGPGAVVEGVFARIGTDWEYWNLVNPEFHSVGDSMVLVTGRYQAKHNATGNEIDAQFAQVWTLSDGNVIKFQQYTDTWQVVNAVRKND